MRHSSPMAEPDLSARALVAAARRQLLETFSQLRAVGAASGTAPEEPAPPEVRSPPDRVAALRFRSLRLGTRLLVLEDAGLLALTARSRQAPLRLLESALTELQPELLRRRITAFVDLEGELPELWLDGDQVMELLRCALDDGLESIGTDGHLSLSARVSGGVLAIHLAHDGRPGWRDALDVTLLRGLALRLGGTVEMRAEGPWCHVTVALPVVEVAADGAATTSPRRAACEETPIPPEVGVFDLQADAGAWALPTPAE